MIRLLAIGELPVHETINTMNPINIYIFFSEYVLCVQCILCVYCLSAQTVPKHSRERQRENNLIGCPGRQLMNLRATAALGVGSGGLVA